MINDSFDVVIVVRETIVYAGHLLRSAEYAWDGLCEECTNLVDYLREKVCDSRQCRHNTGAWLNQLRLHIGCRQDVETGDVVEGILAQNITLCPIAVCESASGGDFHAARVHGGRGFQLRGQ